jgi:hypothetical protein
MAISTLSRCLAGTAAQCRGDRRLKRRGPVMNYPAGSTMDRVRRWNIALWASQVCGCRLDDVSAARLNYPHWHQAKTARDRLSAADLNLLGPYL